MKGTIVGANLQPPNNREKNMTDTIVSINLQYTTRDDVENALNDYISVVANEIIERKVNDILQWLTQTICDVSFKYKWQLNADFVQWLHDKPSHKVRETILQQIILPYFTKETVKVDAIRNKIKMKGLVDSTFTITALENIVTQVVKYTAKTKMVTTEKYIQMASMPSNLIMSREEIERNERFNITRNSDIDYNYRSGNTTQSQDQKFYDILTDLCETNSTMNVNYQQMHKDSFEYFYITNCLPKSEY